MCGLSIAQTKQKLKQFFLKVALVKFMEILVVCSHKVVMSSNVNSAFLFIVVSTPPTAHPPDPQGKIVCSLFMSLIVSLLDENSRVRQRYCIERLLDITTTETQTQPCPKNLIPISV